MRTLYYRIRNFVRHYRAFGFLGALDVVRGRRQQAPLYPVRVKYCGQPLWVRRDQTDFIILQHSTIFRSGFTPQGFTPRVILDIGANIGITTAILAARWPEARIIAVEPDPENFELLERNCQAFQNVEMYRAAIWDRDEALTIINPEGPAFGFRVEAVSSQANSAPEYEVEGISIPTLMKRLNLESLDFVKIDVESGEKTIFRSNTEDWLPLVRVLAVELHDFMEPGCSDAVFSAVRPFEPRHFELDEYEVFHFPESATEASLFADARDDDNN